MKNGILISLEGPEGAGKSSVLEALLPFLQSYGTGLITTREPGGVQIAEAIREVILEPSHTAMDAKTELLLYIASRRQHLAERVLPALTQGKLVLMDRFIDSSVAYQGYGRGLDVADIEWLDIEVEEGLARIARSESREVNRLDLEGLDLHQRVRQGYLAILDKETERFVKVDASQPLDRVVADSLAIIQERFGNPS